MEGCPLPEGFGELASAVEELLRSGKRITVAIDGMCGSGKSTLAEILARRFGGNVFHCDDFYLPMSMRSPQRLAEPGGNMHRERLREEVLGRLESGEPFSYGVFEHRVMDVGHSVTVEPRALNLIEGSYSMHPELRPYYDLTVFCKLSPEEQQARILGRNGAEKLREFNERWIPMENAYFRALEIEKHCDLVINTGPEGRLKRKT